MGRKPYAQPVRMWEMTDAEGYREAVNRLRQLGGPPSFQSAGERILRAVFHHGHAPASTLWRSSGLNSRPFYHALWRLVREGILIGVPVEGRVYFGFAHPPHDHMVCLSCHKVVDLPREGAALRVDLPGWSLKGDHLVGYGLCPECSVILSEIRRGLSF